MKWYTSSRDDSGGQTDTRWNSRWASPAERNRFDSLHLTFQSSPVAPLLFGAQGSQGSFLLSETRTKLSVSHTEQNLLDWRATNLGKLTFPHMLLLLFYLIGHYGQLGLECRRSVSPSKFIESLPGSLQGADETLLEVRAHPGETLLQLWNAERDGAESNREIKLFTPDWRILFLPGFEIWNLEGREVRDETHTSRQKGVLSYCVPRSTFKNHFSPIFHPWALK